MKSKSAAKGVLSKGTAGVPRKGAEVAKRLVLIDDHPITLAGMQQLIESEPGLSVVATARSAEEALTVIGAKAPDLVVTDLTLPGKNGIELIKDLHALKPDLPVLVLSMHDEVIYAERALRAGARGYLMKEAGSEKLLTAIARVLGGEVYVSERMSAQILARFSGQRPRGSNSPIERLSDREFEVFQLLGQGKTTREIADQLHLSSKTVDVHRANIKEKLAIGSGTELVRFAIRWVDSQGGGQG